MLLPPKKIEYSKNFLPFEKHLLKLKNIPQDGFNFVRSSFTNTAFKYFYSFKPHLTELHKNYYKLINDLRKDKTILILKPDKGNAVVLLNNIDYHQKMINILNDTPNSKSQWRSPNSFDETRRQDEQAYVKNET